MTTGNLIVFAVMISGDVGTFLLGIYYRYDRRVASPAVAIGAWTAIIASLAALALNAGHRLLVPFLFVLLFLFIPVAWLGRRVAAAMLANAPMPVLPDVPLLAPRTARSAVS